MGLWKWVLAGGKCVGEWVDGLVVGTMGVCGSGWVLAGGKCVCEWSVEVGRCWLVGVDWW